MQPHFYFLYLILVRGFPPESIKVGLVSHFPSNQTNFALLLVIRCTNFARQLKSLLKIFSVNLSIPKPISFFLLAALA